jgi:uncharacterized protein YuzE
MDALVESGSEDMIEYSLNHDSLYVNINDSGASLATTRPIDSRREVDYAQDGSVIAVHFLQASLGIELDGVPERDRVEEALRQLTEVLRSLPAGASGRPPRSGRIGGPHLGQ